MAKSWDKYLAEHDNDAEAAGRAAASDVAKRENQNSGARAFARAYGDLITSMKLPADVSTDTEDEAKTLAAKALKTLSTPAESPEDSDTLDTLRGLLDAYAEHTGIDLVSVLEGIDDKTTDEQVDALIAGAFQPLTDLQGKARTGDLMAAAAALGKPADALAEILEGKTLTTRKVKAEDGTESDVWGIPGDGDSFKPLTDLKAIQYLATATPASPPPPLTPRAPAQEARGTPPTPNKATVQEIAAQKAADPSYQI